MSQLDIKEFRLQGHPDDGSPTLCVKRYRPTFGDRKLSAKSITLLLGHCVGGHKEQWESTLVHLFDLQRSSVNGSNQIYEAWSMDAPNHGEAAVANEEALLKNPGPVSGHIFARAVQVLLSSGLLQKMKIVPITHSASAVAFIFSASSFPLADIPYSTMILIEPTMMTREIFANAFGGQEQLAAVIKSIEKKKDTWSNRSEAMAWLRARRPWNSWDSRLLQCFVDYGLRDLPTLTYPERSNGVTLKCTRMQEAASYVAFEDGFDSLTRLSQLCASIPVHCIFGSKVDLISEETQQGIVDETQGRKMASISKVPNAGHMVVQENPAGLAYAIYSTLSKPLQSQL